MRATRLIEKLNLPSQDPADSPSSSRRFSDGGQYRIEIPSTEGPKVLRAVLEEAAARKVPVHRVSQGSGIMLMASAEITDMLAIGREANVEVNLFIGPRATFDTGAQVFSPAGRALGLSARGATQLAFALEDLLHAIDLGLKSVLVSDLGVLQIIGKLKQSGDLPRDLIIKTSVMMAPCNPASAPLLEDLGATTPLKYTDPDGNDITLFYRAAASGKIDFGHVFIGVLNQDTGKTGFLDFYPSRASAVAPGAVNGGYFGERQGKYASLTIQTTPEVAQKALAGY